MHLINTRTYELEHQLAPKPYAILSHTWKDNQEVLYQDFINEADKGRTKKGFMKIEHLCTQAEEDKLSYAWIDTVCIDKTSSAELSEAINSMFAWYREAEVCYVFLDDVDHASDLPRSRWITRGWTLQELLAPKNIRFYNRDWVCIGSKSSLVPQLVQCTRIDQIALTNPETIHLHSAATRMSWAAFRQTTRREDMAYCLLGIFGVNMPLLYGERDKAFVRLQEQILKQDQDVTLLACDRTEEANNDSTLLARSPDAFGKWSKVMSMDPTPCELTGRGLRLQLQILRPLDDHPGADFLAVLACRPEFEPDHLTAIPVVPVDITSDIQNVDELQEFTVCAETFQTVPRTTSQGLPHKDILLLRKTPLPGVRSDLWDERFTCSLKADLLCSHGYKVVYAVPENGISSWDSARMVSEIVSTNRIIIVEFALVHSQHNEAFIFRFAVDRRSDAGNEQAWCSVEAKPSEADHAAWTEQNNIHNLLAQPSSGSTWYRSGYYSGSTGDIVSMDGVQWTFLGNTSPNTHQPALKARKVMFLHSRRCYSSICVDVAHTARKSRVLGKGEWTIKVEPMGQCTEIDDPVMKTEAITKSVTGWRNRIASAFSHDV